MKYLFLIFLLFLSQISTKQIWVKTGTGLKDVSYQWKLPGMKTGCLFMAVCAIGGLGSDKEMLSARKWANSKGYVRGTTCYINIKELLEKFLSNLKLLIIVIGMLKKVAIIIGLLMVREKKFLILQDLDILIVRNK